jgi:single-strand DNA-binding protein
MASSLNKVELIGRLGKDPEIKNLSNGSAVANFSVATSESWKDKRSGEKQEKTEWHNIVVWNEKTIEFVEKYLNKGDLVRIEGKIQTRKWEDQDGKDRYSTEIVIPQFAPIEALMKLSFDNDNSRDNDRGSSRGSSSRGSSRSRDDDRGSDDRGSSRASSSRASSSRSSRDEDRGSEDRGGDRGSSRRGSRDDDRNDDRSGSRNAPRRAVSGGRNDDMDDDIPF